MELSNQPAANGRLRLAQGLVLLFHGTGFLGLVYSSDPAFYLMYTPLTLLLTAGLLAAFQPQRNWYFWQFGLLTFLVGFAAEFVGVQYGRIFGTYAYGPTLGWQWAGVPWLIGLNWAVLTYLAGMLAAYLPIPGWARVLVGALLMVGFDLCLEPVAEALKFWEWAGHEIPERNFRDWFLVSLLQQTLFVQAGFVKHNRLVPLVYLVQLLFFFGLGWVLR